MTRARRAASELDETEAEVPHEAARLSSLSEMDALAAPGSQAQYSPRLPRQLRVIVAWTPATMARKSFAWILLW